MKTTYKISMVLAAAMWMIGCAQGGGPNHGTTHKAMTHAEVVGLLAFLNDEETTFEVLDVECAIRSDSARQIIKYRDHDGNSFDSIEEVLDVHMVGPWTVDMLRACAAEFGFVPSEEDLELLAFVNDQADTTFVVLDRDCQIRSDSARNIIAYRDGADGIPGTADDNLFDHVDELDGVFMVGSWTVDMLRTCAQTGGTPPADPDPTPEPDGVTYVYDVNDLDPTLADLVQGQLFDFVNQYRDTSVYFEILFAEVVIYTVGTTPVSYEVKYFQWIDPEGGIQLWFVVSLDAGFNTTGIDVYI